MRKKIKSLVTTAYVAGLTLPAVAMAQFKEPGGTGLPGGSITNIVNNAMNWILAIVGAIGIIGFAVAGILYLTAAGDEDRIETAKKAMLYSIIGIIVALLGLVILRAVSTMLQGQQSTF
ncbi:MAG: pilin [Candidatus Moranbacteria bacterium]|nr:pilin [Candidatus Moranbacteria bacterium]